MLIECGGVVQDVLGAWTVASIVLVSPGLECPGVSLVEVCATCLRCHLW